jgi:hypothetical protein
VAGALLAAVEVSIVLAGGDDIWMSIMLAVFGGTLAIVGPDAWSIDAAPRRRGLKLGRILEYRRCKPGRGA